MSKPESDSNPILLAVRFIAWTLCVLWCFGSTFTYWLAYEKTTLIEEVTMAATRLMSMFTAYVLARAVDTYTR